jgi:hypothetical protein
MHRKRNAELSRSEGDSGHGASGVDEILSETAPPYAAQGIKEKVKIPGSVPAFGESRAAGWLFSPVPTASVDATGVGNFRVERERLRV